MAYLSSSMDTYAFGILHPCKFNAFRRTFYVKIGKFIKLSNLNRYGITEQHHKFNKKI